MPQYLPPKVPEPRKPHIMIMHTTVSHIWYLLIQFVAKNWEHRWSWSIIRDDCVLDEVSTCKLVEIITRIHICVELVKNVSCSFNATLIWNIFWDSKLTQKFYLCEAVVLFILSFRSQWQTYSLWLLSWEDCWCLKAVDNVACILPGELQHNHARTDHEYIAIHTLFLWPRATSTNPTPRERDTTHKDPMKTTNLLSISVLLFHQGT